MGLCENSFYAAICLVMLAPSLQGLIRTKFSTKIFWNINNFANIDDLQNRTCFLMKDEYLYHLYEDTQFDCLIFEHSVLDSVREVESCRLVLAWLLKSCEEGARWSWLPTREGSLEPCLLSAIGFLLSWRIMWKKCKKGKFLFEVCKVLSLLSLFI